MPVHHAAVPLFEYSVQVGFPSPAESYKETFDFNDLLIENSPGDLCVAYLRAVDIDVGICDGDLMVVDRSRNDGNNKPCSDLTKMFYVLICQMNVVLTLRMSRHALCCLHKILK